MMTILHFLGYGLDLLLLIGGAVLFGFGAFGRLGAAVIPALAAVPGIVFVVLRWAGVALMVYAGGTIWLRNHDASLQASWAADQRAATAADLADAYTAGQKAVADEQAAEAAVAQESAPIHEEIARREALAPVAVPTPVGAVLDELRRRSAGSGSRP
jgi:hypothetical protein